MATTIAPVTCSRRRHENRRDRPGASRLEPFAGEGPRGSRRRYDARPRRRSPSGGADDRRNRDRDDPVVTEARRLGVRAWRGSEQNVLARYIGAARTFAAGAVVRVTSDCPLLDPETIDKVVTALRSSTVDYASNTHTRSYPRGLDVEAFYLETLERIFDLATSAAAKEHVTAYLMEKPEAFSIHQVIAETDDSDLRWTVDTE